MTLDSTRAWGATCWDANLSEYTGHTAHPETSKRQNIGWDEFNATTCTSEPGGWTFDHYRVEHSDSCISGWSAGDGTWCISAWGVSNTEAWWSSWLSDYEQCYAVFACNSDDSICLDADYDVIDNVATLTTEEERWVAVDISASEDSTGTADRVGGSASGDGRAPEFVRIPPSWTSSACAGSLALLLHNETSGGITIECSTSTSWTDWNTDTFSSAEVLVANATESGASGDWSDIGYPWAIVASNGSDTGLLLAMQLFQSTISDDGEIGLVLGTDKMAEDLGIECAATSGGSPADCSTSECLNGDLCDLSDDTADGNEAEVLTAILSSPPTMDHLAHGRFVRMDPTDPVWDFCTEDMTMLFTGNHESTGPDSIYLAQYTAPNSSPCTITDGVWEIHEDGSGNAEPVIEDNHDPFVIPSPGGWARVYAKEACVPGGGLSGTCGPWRSFYTNDGGLTFDHTAYPSFFWDGDTEITDADACFVDMTGIRWIAAPTQYDGIFAWVVSCAPAASCSCTTVQQGGSIIFFQLDN